MKKISMIAAAALAVSAAAPAFAGDKVQSNPFVSSQAEGGIGAIGAGTVAVAVTTVAVIAGSADGT